MTSKTASGKQAKAEVIAARARKLTKAQAAANMAAHPRPGPLPAGWKPTESKRQFRNLTDRNPLYRFEEVGQVLEGRLNGLRATDTQNGPATVADLTTDGGQNVSFFVSAGMGALNDRALIGSYVRLTYQGRKLNKNSGREFKAFAVEVADDGEGGDDASDEIPF